jgi:hypothetical protein
MDSNRDRIPAELASIAERLRAEREIPGALELDQMKGRAKRQAASAATSHQRQKGNPLKSRVVLTLAIVLGLMMSTTGAGLAISGSSGQGNAAEAQYQEKDDGQLGEEEGAVQGQEQGDGDGGDDAQPIEQAAVVSEPGDDSGSSLPFTGFFTIPLIVGGVALLTGGALLRWKSRE